MAGSFHNKSSNDDSIDISELASLNEDISDDFLNELEGKLSSEVNSFAENTQENENDDSTLFEETTPQEDTIVSEEKNQEPAVENIIAEVQEPDDVSALPQEPENTAPEEEKKEDISVNQSFDDNFIKKYKAKLNKKAQAALQSGAAVNGQMTTKYMQQEEKEADGESIETLSNGNISEHPLTADMKNYNESLDFLDGNVKYSKYVIYIDPKNVDFIDSLTVKERKNLINRILRQQDDISITKQRFALIQTIIRQVIIAVITISISIPFVYYLINASLEATIDNHRRSQTNWQTLYKQHGKITQN